MRRSSVITIVLLVLVIIGLIVALIVTNLSSNNEIDNSQNTQTSLNGEGAQNINQETGTAISLDSEIVQKAYKIIRADEELYNVKGASKTIKDFTNEQIQYIAYLVSAIDKMEMYKGNGVDRILSKDGMDDSVREVFGDVTYNPTNVNNLEYNSEEQVYYRKVGYGGSVGYNPYSISAIVKAEEFSDRYEITEKYLYLVPTLVYNENGQSVGARYKVMNGNSYLDDILGEYKEVGDLNIESVKNIPTVEELVNNVQEKEMYNGTEEESSKASQTLQRNINVSKKLISKYYDDAAEYKHTFMKNEDGTYYWLKTEIVK